MNPIYKSRQSPFDKGLEGWRVAIFIIAFFSLLSCEHPAKVDIGELVEALNALDADLSAEAEAEADEDGAASDALIDETVDKDTVEADVVKDDGPDYNDSEDCCLPTDEDYVETDEDGLLTETEVEDDVVPDEDVPDLSEVEGVPDEDTDVVLCTADVCTDYSTGLMWEKTSSASTMDHAAAITYCENQTTGTFDNWRLPTISELRTLVKGCAGTEIGGDCAVTDPECLSFASCYSADCYCVENGGPGENGNYWEPGIWLGTGNMLWSSSIETENAPNQIWRLEFNFGSTIDRDRTHNEGTVRCVRDAMTRTTKQWGTSVTEYGRSVAVDSSGNIFVVGYTNGALDGNTNAGGQDIFLTKWNVNGTKAWTKQWGTSSSDIGASVVVDATGNIYIVGNTTGGLDGNTKMGTPDIFLTKWNADGTKGWTKQWGATGVQNNGDAVSVDTIGNIYVAGNTYGDLDGNASAGEYDIFLTKWEPSGTKVWTKQWGTSVNEAGLSVVVNLNGDIYVTGYTNGTFEGNTSMGGGDAFLAKWNVDGTKGWTKQWGSGFDEMAYSVAIGSAGKIMVAGLTAGEFDGNTSAGGVDIFLSIFSLE